MLCERPTKYISLMQNIVLILVIVEYALWDMIEK